MISSFTQLIYSKSIFKYIFVVSFIMILSACEDEKIITGDSPPDNEKKITSDSLLPFKINNIYPPYAFWESGIRLTLDKKEGFDASKLQIFFNDSLLKQYEVNNTETQFIILTKIPNMCKSGKLEFQYNLGDTILSKFSENYEIVNSEVRIDSIRNTFCGPYISVYGNGMKYIKHIGMQFSSLYSPSNFYYGNNLPLGESISNSKGLLQFISKNYIKLYLSVNDSILSPNHPYPVTRTFEIKYDKYNYFALNNPHNFSAYIDNKTVNISAKEWYGLNEDDIIKFGNVIIDKSKIKFTPHTEFMSYQMEWVEYYALLTFPIPVNATNNKLEIDFGCIDNDYVYELPNESDFKEAKILIQNIDYLLEFSSNSSQDNLDGLRSINYIKDGFKPNLVFPNSFNITIEEKSSSYSMSDVYNLKIDSLSKNYIKFTYRYEKLNKFSGNSRGSYYTSEIFNYEGLYDLIENANEIRIKLDTKLLENVNFNAYLKSESSEYGSYSKFYEGATNKLILKDNSEFEIQLFKKK